MCPRKKIRGGAVAEAGNDRLVTITKPRQTHKHSQHSHSFSPYSTCAWFMIGLFAELSLEVGYFHPNTHYVLNNHLSFIQTARTYQIFMQYHTCTKGVSSLFFTQKLVHLSLKTHCFSDIWSLARDLSTPSLVPTTQSTTAKTGGKTYCNRWPLLPAIWYFLVNADST